MTSPLKLRPNGKKIINVLNKATDNAVDQWFSNFFCAIAPLQYSAYHHRPLTLIRLCSNKPRMGESYNWWVGITQIAKENAVKSKEKVLHGSWAIVSLRRFCPLLLFAPWCFSFAPKWAILPTLRNTALDTSTSSDTDYDRDASSTCLSDSFLAVRSHNQSDEDLAMSIKYRGVSFPSPSQTVDANAFMHEELMELLIHYDTALPSSHERI